MRRRKREPKANRAVPVDTEELIAVFELWPGEGQRRVSDTKEVKGEREPGSMVHCAQEMGCAFKTILFLDWVS